MRTFNFYLHCLDRPGELQGTATAAGLRAVSHLSLDMSKRRCGPCFECDAPKEVVRKGRAAEVIREEFFL